MSKHTPTTDKLIKALDQEGITYELNAEGNVILNDEVRAFMDKRGILGDPDNPVELTEEELMYGRDVDVDDDDDPGYDFLKADTAEEVHQMINDGTVEVGTSEVEAPTPRHRSVEVYLPVRRPHADPERARPRVRLARPSDGPRV